MKLLMILLFIPFISFAKVVPQHIDDAFSYRYEESVPESNRGIATDDEQLEASDEEVEVVDDSDRDLASQEDEKEEPLQKHRKELKYWKY